MKRCPRCGKTKPIDGFFRDRSRRDGRSSYCRPCHTAACPGPRSETFDCERCGKTVTRQRNPQAQNICFRCAHPAKGNLFLTRGRKAFRARDGSRVMYYRAVMEGHLGRHLRPDEHVHHINGDKADDRIENLQLVSAAEHADLHRDVLQAGLDAVNRERMQHPFAGVHRRRGGWGAGLSRRGHRYWLGVFPSRADAKAARDVFLTLFDLNVRLSTSSPGPDWGPAGA